MAGISVSGITYTQQSGVTSGENTSTPKEPTVPERRTEERPSISEMMREAREKVEARRDKFQRLKPKQNYGDAPLAAYSRLSRARTPAQASAAAGYARRRIAQLQAAKGQDGENAREIQSAINQLRKVTARAGRKRRELEQDQVTEARRKRLEEEEQIRKARRLRQELMNRRTQRAIRESGYFREVEIEKRLQAQLTATEMELRNQIQSLSDSVQTSLGEGAQYGASQPAPEPEISVEA